ncbi:unnamed protein product [Schistosoma curassoni]|nr:unnamed protein product [Schistosoma curassoni]
MLNQRNNSTNTRSNFLCLPSILTIVLFFLKSASCNKRLNSNSQEILDLHTKYRQDLIDCKVDGQPPAKYMSPLKWNYNLAAQAQKLANKCILQHDKRHSDEFSWVGQNIALCPTIKSGNWNNEKPYEVKSRELCPKMQNIPKDSFQRTRDDTLRAPLSIVNVNHKLSSIGSSESLVNDQPSTGLQRTLDEKSLEILELHRKYRQDLIDCKVDGQPPAKYMSPLKWNYNLAAQAQKLANKCILQHDKRHSNEFSWVGQNIALCPTIKSGNWNNEKPYEVKSRELCPKMQNIPKDSFQRTRDDTLRAPLSIVNVNHKLSSIGSSEGLVNDQPSTGLQRTLDEKSLEILELHRKYRQDLIDCKVDGQPPAKYMSPLKWNYNLAAQAQKLANKCILQHDKRHSNEFSWVGQNIALCPTIKSGNWNNEKPYEVKSRELCPKMQNIPKDSFQRTRDDTLRAPLSIVNVNHKLSSIGSSEGLVNDQPSTGLQRTLDEKSLEILELHRKYRQDLIDCKVDGQPPAKYMSPLKWNYNLAAQAQKLANKCILQHDKRHSNEFSWVGQNIALCPTIKSGNWNNEKPYEVKSRELCPKMQNIPKDSFQRTRDDTLRAPLSIVNVNHKLSSIGSSEGLVNDQPSTGLQRTLDEKSLEILELHRKYRQDLIDCKVDGQPPAKYMSPLKWNYNLAAQAQKLANKCILQHDKRHSNEFSWVGQNIALCPTIKSGNWNNEKPYEVKSRELCPKMQNIPKDSFQRTRDDTLRAPLSIVNVNHKLSSIGSSEGLVNDQPSTGLQRTLDEKSLEILELHRKYRQDLIDCKVDGQPPAKYMSPLKWNYNLAAQAQKLANKCILQHDKRHSNEFSWVGQNIALCPTIKSGNWNNEKPYEVKSRELCPKMQNIPKDSFQRTRDDTLRAPLSIVNVNHKLSSIGSSEGLVNDQPSTGLQRTLDEKSLEILELHRKYRQDLIDCKVDGQPPAKYMSPLKWNYNLAAQAQKLANKCILQHDKRHSNEFSWVGQNIALCPTIKSGNWNNEKPYEVKSRELCPKMQNIPKDSFQRTRDDTLRAPLSIVNVNHKLSSIGSSEGLVNDQPSTGLQRTLDEKSLEILELHRKYRQDLIDCKVDGQPPAKYMSPLKWNYNLAAQAQKLANKCILQHDKRHSNEFSWVGQNIALCPTIKSGNWNNEKPYEVKSRELCPKMQNIPKDSFQRTRDDTLRAPLSIVNVNHKLSSIRSSGSRVHDQRKHDQPISINAFQYSRSNTQRKWRSGNKALQKL